MEGVHAETDLQHQGQQERRRAGTDAKDPAAENTDFEASHLQQFEIQNRIGTLPCKGNVKCRCHYPDKQQSQFYNQWNRGQANNRKAEHQAKTGEARQDKADTIDGGDTFRLYVGNLSAGKKDAQYSNRHIDEKNPFPGKKCGDKPANGWAEQGAYKRWNRKPGESIHQLVLFHRHRMSSRPTGVIIAPPIPCMERAITKSRSEPANAHITEPMMKTPIAVRKTRRAP